MKTATYRNLDGSPRVVEYDENFPCLICKRPVIEASVGGTAVCPWCDTGKYRDGCTWDYRIAVYGQGHIMEPRFSDDALGCWHHRSRGAPQ